MKLAPVGCGQTVLALLGRMTTKHVPSVAQMDVSNLMNSRPGAAT